MAALVVGVAGYWALSWGVSKLYQAFKKAWTAEDERKLVLTMTRMESSVDVLRSPVTLPNATKTLEQDILQPFFDLVDQYARQRLGDHLAEIGVADVLKNLLETMDEGNETKEGWQATTAAGNVLSNYSEASLKVAKKIGECGLLGKFVDDMSHHAGSTNVKSEKHKHTLFTAVHIIHNCAKATENRQVFRDTTAVEALLPFLQSDDSKMVIITLLTLSYITEEKQISVLEADEGTILILRDILRNATNNQRLESSTEDWGTWSALEIVTGIANIAVNPKNSKKLIEADVIPLLFDVMKKGDAIVKESTANALWVLASSSHGKIKIREHPRAVHILKQLSRNANTNIAAAMQRVLLRIQQQPMYRVSMGSLRRTCEYAQNCKLFMDELGISEHFFDISHDKCYCTPCHASRYQNLYYTQGEPAKDYVVPIGWCRYALRIPPAARSLGANEKWHVAYHGTSPSSVKPILECGQLLIPGDTALGGKKLSEVGGHFCDDRKPEGFNTKQVFVSPSIRYSGLEVYSKTQSFRHPRTWKTYKAKVALQLWIKPDSYKVGQQTVGAEEEIDPKFTNQEIEWSTVERGAIHLYGLLIRLDE